MGNVFLADRKPVEIIDVNTLLDAQSQSPLVDVRSPGEFAHGHIPGAVNLPLFDDAERAEVGTLYKQRGRAIAIGRGLEIAESKAQWLVDSVNSLTNDTSVLVHCWRGGMRSEGVAWLCEDCGLRPRVLEGGYKTFRRAAHQCFGQQRHLIVLAGHTGAGKTLLLEALAEHQQQVIDLEKLANHRGSAFGGIEQAPQPTAEQFENELFLQLRATHPEKTLWVEGESRSIGKVQIPQGFWDLMAGAPMLFVEVDQQRRLDFLVEQYGQFPKEQLSSAIQRISKRLGGDRLRSALESLEQGDLRSFAAIALDYYDRAYTRALNKRPPDHLTKLPLTSSGNSDDVETLIAMAKSMLAE